MIKSEAGNVLIKSWQIRIRISEDKDKTSWTRRVVNKP